MSRQTISLPKEQRDQLQDVLPALNQRFSQTKNRLGSQPVPVITEFLSSSRHAIQNGLLCDQDAYAALLEKESVDRRENMDADRTIPEVDYFFQFDNEETLESQASEHSSIVRPHEIWDAPEKSEEDE